MSKSVPTKERPDQTCRQAEEGRRKAQQEREGGGEEEKPQGHLTEENRSSMEQLGRSIMEKARKRRGKMAKSNTYHKWEITGQYDKPRVLHAGCHSRGAFNKKMRLKSGPLRNFGSVLLEYILHFHIHIITNTVHNICPGSPGVLRVLIVLTRSVEVLLYAF